MKVHLLIHKDYSSGLRVSGLGLGFRVRGFRFRAWVRGLGFEGPCFWGLGLGLEGLSSGLGCWAWVRDLGFRGIRFSVEGGTILGGWTHCKQELQQQTEPSS